MNTIQYVPEAFIVSVATSAAPRCNSVTGYGNKIPTQYRIQCADKRTRRVYAICYSNAASLYIVVNGARQFLRDWQLEVQS